MCGGVLVCVWCGVGVCGVLLESVLLLLVFVGWCCCSDLVLVQYGVSVVLYRNLQTMSACFHLLFIMRNKMLL